MRYMIAGATAAWLVATAALADDTGDRTTALFVSEQPLEITLAGPIQTIARSADRSTDPHPATLALAGETHGIELAARGVSRRKRENCSFPPMRIAVSQKAAETSILHRQGSLKLVTHCNQRASSDQTLLREYATYRLYNAITPESLKARLVRVTYVDGGTALDTRWGFLIEDADDAARRIARKEVDIGTFEFGALNRQDAARYALFQYMVGNTDWDMTQGPDAQDCCHNSKVFGASKDATSDLTPVPYDFDNAGLVDASYAAPNAALPIVSVKVRLYRGYCALNDDVLVQAGEFRRARGTIHAQLDSVPGLEPRSREAMRKYLDGFFERIATDDDVRKNLLRKCR
ncbi:hypothetical protein [Qipengyuania zhejiangensis]|uniref:hypothetical protein n=1 Tax=Qipengyuania zhejiangensis TaxID=3077782 RepID=UPI002D799532|nr:hypothetical protein [Qipengyuania sp. Z2]